MKKSEIPYPTWEVHEYELDTFRIELFYFAKAGLLDKVYKDDDESFTEVSNFLNENIDKYFEDLQRLGSNKYNELVLKEYHSVIKEKCNGFSPKKENALIDCALRGKYVSFIMDKADAMFESDNFIINNILFCEYCVTKALKETNNRI